jgi:hypothetical protein
MRSPEEIRDELAVTAMHYAQLESKDSQHARAVFEKMRWLRWTLEETVRPSEPAEAPTEPDPPKRENGSSDKLAAVTLPEDDEGGDDE